MSVVQLVAIVLINFIHFLETAMGITKETQDSSGFDYAMAVMK